MKKLDDILKQALTPEDEPDFWLNQNILSQTKEDMRMKNKKMKKIIPVTLSAALALGVGSVSIYAAWKYLTPDEVIKEIDEPLLTEAFSGDDAILINETQSYGDYDVTLLGVTSGKNLTEYKYITYDNSVTLTPDSNSDNQFVAADDPLIHDDRSYILFAVESADPSFTSIYERSPIEPFDIVPVIGGYDPEKYPTLFINGCGAREIKKDGTVYLMCEFDNLEIFADHEIYLCVSDDLPAYSEYSYIYDETAGTLARNEEYEGLNALFRLPLDPSKADPAAAEAYVKSYEERVEKTKEAEKTSPESVPEDRQKAEELANKITPENLDDYATPLEVEGATQIITPDAQGRIFYRIYSENGNSGYAKAAIKDIFPDGKTDSITCNFQMHTGVPSYVIEFLSLNEDGTVTVQHYTLKDSILESLK